jgi:hypothetical protein
MAAEGFAKFPYYDRTGWRWGYGTPAAARDQWVSEATAGRELDRWLSIAEGDCREIFGAAWDTFGPVRCEAFVEMAFNLGGPRLRGFKRMIARALVRDWQGVTRECLDSDAARDLPGRYERIAQALLTGEDKP